MEERLSLVVMAVMLSATIVVCGLVALRCLRVFVRGRRTGGPQRASTWNGAVFDSNIVAARVRHLRENHLAELTGRAHDKWQRRERVAKARETVCSRSYFQHAMTERPAPDAELNAH